MRGVPTTVGSSKEPSPSKHHANEITANCDDDAEEGLVSFQRRPPDRNANDDVDESGARTARSRMSERH